MRRSSRRHRLALLLFVLRLISNHQIPNREYQISDLEKCQMEV
jgi:hypothetical protein